MKTNQSAEEAKRDAAKGELKPKDAVRRVLEAAGAEVSDKEAFWLGHHMERFVNHTRKHGELLEFPVAVEAYLAFFMQTSPADWQVDQLKQALVLFGRGTERWRWVRVEEGEQMTEYGGQKSNPMAGPQGWVLRYRVWVCLINKSVHRWRSTRERESALGRRCPQWHGPLARLRLGRLGRAPFLAPAEPVYLSNTP